MKLNRKRRTGRVHFHCMQWRPLVSDGLAVSIAAKDDLKVCEWLSVKIPRDLLKDDLNWHVDLIIYGHGDDERAA
jgi:hypothetical protein